jgi:hypothetical protein
MQEGFDISVEGTNWKLKVKETTKVFAKKVDRPKIAICPICGEISFFIDNPEDIVKRSK